MIVAGCLLVAAGALVLASGRLPFLGRLPGDIHIRGRHGSFSFPLVTCLVVSIILTIVINVLLRLFRR